MPQSREEIASDLVWRYTEHVRSEGAEPLSDDELEQLLRVLQSVPATGEALAEEGAEARQAAVRKRVEHLLAQSPERSRPAVREAARRPAPALVPAWRFRVACALSAVLAVALASVGAWHHPPARTIVQRMVVPRDIRDVEAMDERQAHELLPKMVHNQLSPKQEKDLMGHMLVCPGCFREYVQLKQHVKDLARSGTQLAVLRRR